MSFRSSKLFTVALGLALLACAVPVASARPATTGHRAARAARLPRPFEVRGGRQVGAAAWSPDGGRIAWVVEPAPGRLFGDPGRSQIWVANADGSQARQRIGALEAAPSELVWTGSAGLLYDANFGVYRALAHRSQSLMSAGGSFSASERGRVVASTNDRGSGPILVYDMARRSTIAVVPSKNSFPSAPSVSPDGSRIAFVNGACDAAGDRCTNVGLWITGATGADDHRIVAGRGLGCPLWSPDETEILFVEQRASHPELAVVRPDGTGHRVLGTGGASPQCSTPSGAAWSPDGRTIAFVERGWRQLVLLDVRSGRTRTISRFRSSIGFAWSPDSRRLLVTARRDSESCASLWVIRADGSDARQLARCRR